MSRHAGAQRLYWTCATAALEHTHCEMHALSRRLESAPGAQSPIVEQSLAEIRGLLKNANAQLAALKEDA